MKTSIRINEEETIAYVSALSNSFTIVFSSGLRLDLTAKQMESIIEKRQADLELMAWLEERQLERAARAAAEKSKN